MSKSKVVILKTSPETVFRDIERGMIMAGFKEVQPKDKVTILKDNISWHFPYISANTTPWQLEGTILALRAMGYNQISSVHNNTVVTNTFKGQILNKLAPIYKRYGVEEHYNFIPEDIKWVNYEPKARMRVLDQIYP
jgi:hypothetical protein